MVLGIAATTAFTITVEAYEGERELNPEETLALGEVTAQHSVCYDSSRLKVQLSARGYSAQAWETHLHLCQIVPAMRASAAA